MRMCESTKDDYKDDKPQHTLLSLNTSTSKANPQKTVKKSATLQAEPISMKFSLESVTTVWHPTKVSYPVSEY